VLSITRFRVGFINDASSQPNFFAPAPRRKIEAGIGVVLSSFSAEGFRFPSFVGVN
jgi:hypothetical protein